jgi:hypothetical protein
LTHFYQQPQAPGVLLAIEELISGPLIAFTVYAYLWRISRTNLGDDILAYKIICF